MCGTRSSAPRADAELLTAGRRAREAAPRPPVNRTKGERVGTATHLLRRLPTALPLAWLFCAFCRWRPWRRLRSVGHGSATVFRGSADAVRFTIRGLATVCRLRTSGSRKGGLFRGGGGAAEWSEATPPTPRCDLRHAAQFRQAATPCPRAALCSPPSLSAPHSRPQKMIMCSVCRPSDGPAAQLVAQVCASAAACVSPHLVISQGRALTPHTWWSAHSSALPRAWKVWRSVPQRTCWAH
jgi:hypothetical protein